VVDMADIQPDGAAIGGQGRHLLLLFRRSPRGGSFMPKPITMDIRHVCDEHAMVHLVINDLTCVNLGKKRLGVSRKRALTCFSCIVYRGIWERRHAEALAVAAACR